MTPKMTQKNYEAIKIYNQKEKIFELKGQIQTLKKQLAIAIGVLSLYAEAPTRNLARCALDRIAEIDGDYSHYWEQQIKDVK